MKKTVFTGAATAIITPMKDNQVDYKKFDELIEWQITEGIDAIVVCGTTGEASTLTDDEHKECIRFAVEKVAGRCETESSGGITLDNLRDYAEAGVDFISVGALTHQIKSLDMSLKAC